MRGVRTESVIPFFAFPPDIRRVIYTTNAIESVNAQLRKIIKTRGQFPFDEIAFKLLWLAIRNITIKWGQPRTSGRQRCSSLLSYTRSDSPMHIVIAILSHRENRQFNV